MKMKRLALLLLPAALALSACDEMPTWLGGHEKPQKRLEGERLPVLKEAASLKPDAGLAAAAVDIPTASDNADWPQHGGPDGTADANPTLPVNLEHRQTAQAGDGNTFDYKLVADPVAGGGAVFAMDADGRISSHDMKNVSEVRWISPGVENKDGEPVMGGGMAYDNGRLYAACGRGLVVALDAKTGIELWRQVVGTPVRAAPRVKGGRVFVVTDDSQLLALDANSGAILWSHRGVNEGTGFLVQASPAVTDELAVGAYPSGEVHALHVSAGDEAWGDAVVAPQQSTSSVFTGIGGDPVIDGNLMYIAGSAGQFAAFDLSTGQRIWEQPVSSVATPWVAGDYVYALTLDSAVVAFQRMDGRVRWVRQLPAYANAKDKKDHYTWHGPVMAGGRLLVTGAHGKMMELSPQDGSVLSETDIPEGIYTSPVVAGGVLYLVSDDATLYALY